ncbi:pimeloyl-ACP methyl ester carboxylesterase [Microbacterium sp. AK009]|uniref:alpha/beta fold hydrolase n=1 Tax=Microbacterium sp. AK009 TaxID=2723068 RepID=UPI0015CD9D0E|nr:alpha/beta hydrolase [Microbacterium sp. AK009]NYF16915.1 pimeloyl-ACP methyl ester carboxylesterase [Microbacterium sp. AK009]
MRSEGTVYVLPGLGLSAEAAAPLATHLSPALTVVGIDLPGHGGSPDAADAGVSALADGVIAAIAQTATGGPWILCGHSMGGKVAAAVADRVLRGDAPLFGLAGLVLLAPSPATPEPMAAEKREQMLSWVADGPISEEDARAFVAANVAAPLPAADEAAAISQVRAMSPRAWRRWLEAGSREDISADLDIAAVPTVVLAGEEDDDLGADAQPDLVAAILPRATITALPGTGHLLLWESPSAVAEAIEALWNAVVLGSTRVPDSWGRIIASDRTDAETRGFLSRRHLADDPGAAPLALTQEQLALLDAIAGRLMPRDLDDRFDLARVVDRELAADRGDGWRPPGLPCDAEAYRLGLDALADVWPSDTTSQDHLISDLIAGKGFAGSPWDDDTTRRWFEDLRVDLAQAWVSHPATSARLGFDGFITAITASDPGFSELRADRRAAWEPDTLGTLATEDDR